MRFLIAFAAVLGYASAGLIAPLVYGADAGDLEGAAIDATVAAENHARALDETQAFAIEAVLQAKSKAARKAAESSRHFHENAYWNSVAAAQSQAAAVGGAVAARAGHLAAPVAPLAYAGYGFPATNGLIQYGLGPHA